MRSSPPARLQFRPVQWASRLWWKLPTLPEMLAGERVPLARALYFLWFAMFSASAMMHRCTVMLRPSRELNPSSMLQLIEQWS